MDQNLNRLTAVPLLVQSLAAEVVALEEKVLQTRSREIRLQKGIASLQEGLQQAEKQLQASRRDRANLQSTIDMLQVRKGLPKLWGMAVGGAFQGFGVGGRGKVGVGGFLTETLGLTRVRQNQLVQHNQCASGEGVVPMGVWWGPRGSGGGGGGVGRRDVV